MSPLAQASTLSTDTDIAVIGAGAAGLASATALRAAGLRVALLEAAPHTGGRARTTTIAGHPFDHGAHWLHAAHRNKLIALARQAGLQTHPDTPWDQRLRVVDPPNATPDLAAYEAAEHAWTQTVTARLAQATEGRQTDCSLAEAATPVAENPWTATIESWEGAIIAAADATDLSLADWHANQLEGENHIHPAGLGTLIARLFQTPASCNTIVTAIAATPQGVRLQTTAGTLTAKAAILTVSTGVLRAEQIAFSPQLPPETLAALNGLPMGLLTKILVHAATQDRLDLPPDTTLFRRLTTRGAPFLSTSFWPNNAPFAVGYIGGAAAWSFAHAPQAAGDFLRETLSATLNRPVAQAFAPETLMTDWATNPLHHGAYAYARPGQTTARATLAQPLWEGRLLYAGEATAPDGLCGTLAGAYRAGLTAAAHLIAGK